MPTEGSYHVASFATNTEAEIRRLNAQVDLFWPVERELFARLGLRQGMTVLDCGCGPGRLIELLKGQTPSLRCTGVEIDPILVETARRRTTELGLRDCPIVEGAAESVALPAGSFDLVILRLVLEHVPEPVRALRNLGKLLKPGGKLVAIDNDFEFHLRTDPPVPQLDRLYEAYCASRRKDGGDPCIGRRLPGLFAEAGLALTSFEVEVVHNALVGDGAFLKAEGAGIPAQLVQSGFLDQGTLEEMTRAWKAMLAAPAHSILRPLFVAVGIPAPEEARVAAREEQPQASRAQAAVTPAATAPTLKAGEGTLPLLLGWLSTVLEREGVAAGDSLVDLGVDSLSAMALQELVRGRLGVEIPIVKLLEDIRVEALARHVDGELSKPKVPRHVRATTPSATPEWEEGTL